MDEGEELRVRGRAVGEEGSLLLVRASLRIGDEVVEAREGRSLELALEGKPNVRLELGDAAFLDMEPAEGPYGELASDPRAAAFRDRAPGDHVRCRLEGLVVLGGSHVAAEGRVVTTESEGAGGYRGAPVVNARALRATLVAVGVDAEERIDRHHEERARTRSPKGPENAGAKPAPPRIPEPYTRAPLALGALSAIGLLHSIDELFVRRRLEGRSFASVVFAASLLVAGLALLRALRRAYLTPFSPATSNPYGRRPPWSGGAIDGTLAAIVVFAPGALAYLAETHAVSRVLYASVALVGAVQAAIVLHGDRPFLRVAWLFLRARPLGREPADGEWGTIDARVPLDPAAVVFSRRTVFTHRSESHDHTTQDANGHTVTTTRTERWIGSTVVGRAEGLLEVEAGERRVRLELGKAAVHVAARRYLPDANAEVAAALEERIRGGDALRILGRVRREGDGVSFRSTGAESLFVFAAPESADPARALLGRFVLGASRFLLPLAVASIACFFAIHDPLFAHRRGPVEFDRGRFGGITAPARCELELSAFVDTEGQGHCRARVECGETVLYGAGSLGFFDCSVGGPPSAPRIEGADLSIGDGDPAFTFSTVPPAVSLDSGLGERLSGRYGALVPTL